MKYFAFVLLVVACLNGYGSHIVGGEFELIHLDSFNYELNLIMYFDDVNGNPQAEDAAITAYIFRKSDHSIMRSVLLVNQGSSYVPYTSIECTIDELITRRIFYSADILLTPSLYDDPEGYYVVWERCCRNDVITNIQRPGETGQAFYLEFPPVVRNDRPFINTSPRLFPPLSDYACVNDFYYVDFAGIDPDGDSLVYSIAHPLAGFSSPAPGNVAPPPSPAPYPLVNWAEGISTPNSIPGNPSLKISKEGLLTVIPNETGLFVFSVLCEEFRNGRKIGEVRRDFQMLVIDCPDPGNKPELEVKYPGENQYTAHPDTVFFSSNEEKCLEFVVRDEDGLEDLKYRVEPVNFNANLNGFFSTREGFVRNPSDSAYFTFCFPDCPVVKDNLHTLDVIAADDACPLPLMDSVRLNVFVEPPPNNPARFDTVTSVISYSITEGDIIGLKLKAHDADGDSIRYSVLAPDFDTEDFDMKITPAYRSPGELNLEFFWDSSCRKYDFNDKKDFTLFLVVEDKDYCQVPDPDVIQLDIHVALPPNTPPEITSDLGAEQASLHILDKLEFNVTGRDADGDQIHMYVAGEDFVLQENGFSTFDNMGVGHLVEPFSWTLDCNTLDPEVRDEFLVYFIVEDQDKCSIRNADTLAVTFNALLPENRSPEIRIAEINSPDIEIPAGDTLSFTVLGIDEDDDLLDLQLLDQEDILATSGAEFSPVIQGKPPVSSPFFWITDCNMLTTDLSERTFEFAFIVQDKKCLVPASDTLDLTVTLMNRQVNYSELYIPNVFTPNNDGFNDFFSVDDLPEDDCSNRFLDVGVYNRHGRQVFFSKRKKFRWNADNVNAGVYYYHIRYSALDYKGYLQVLK